ncbi:MAG: hypothetical protein IBX57_03175 [Gammaproteobacteria bacterium]|nr:hypothetical protein [Gammaproteobacteria bacterium]
MSTRVSLLVSTLIICLTLIACSESETPETPALSKTATATATSKQNTASATLTAATIQNTKIEVGMTEQEVKAILGDPKIIQTRTIDDLTITDSEWTDKSGKTSVQFQNGKVKFNHFFPASEE